VCVARRPGGGGGGGWGVEHTCRNTGKVTHDVREQAHTLHTPPPMRTGGMNTHWMLQAEHFEENKPNTHVSVTHFDSPALCLHDEFRPEV